MKKRLLIAGISTLCLALLAMGGCADDSSDVGQNAALLLGLNSPMTEEEAAFAIATALPGTQDMTLSSSSEGSMNVVPTKEMMAEISKSASAAFLKSELAAQGPRETVSVVIDDTCEEGTCYTLSGTGICANGGTMTFNNMQMNMEMVSDEGSMSMTGNMNGSVTYLNCGGKARSMLTYPEYVYAVIDGTIAENDESVAMSMLFSGDIKSGFYTMSMTSTGARYVTSESVSVNGVNYSQVDLVYTSDLEQNVQVSNMTQVIDGSIYRFSGDYVETITGRVAVEGTLGPESEVSVERIFNAETFRYHSDCILDPDNFGSSCSVRRM